MTQMLEERSFACPDDDCTFTVRSDDVDEVVRQAMDHTERDHGERLQRRTVIWKMRTDDHR